MGQKNSNQRQGKAIKPKVKAKAKAKAKAKNSLVPTIINYIKIRFCFLQIHPNINKNEIIFLN